MRQTRVDHPAIGSFTREEFERAWYMEGHPPWPRGSPPTMLVVRRRDWPKGSAGRLRVSIDHRPCVDLDGGGVISHRVAPGAHVLLVSNLFCTTCLTVQVDSGQHVRVACGTGVRRARWWTRLLPYVNRFMVWATQEEPVR